MDGTVTKEQRETLPSTAAAVDDLLKQMGVEEYEPRVVYQILEFISLYTQGVIETAEEYALHSGSKEIQHQDVSLALGKAKGPTGTNDPLGVYEPVIPTGFPSKPNAQLLKLVAEKLNAKAFPKIEKKLGISLPVDDDCLTAQNFELRQAPP